MFTILWAIGGWDHEAGEVVAGGVCLDQCETLDEALALAPSHAVVAGRRHGEGCVVVVDERGERVDLRTSTLKPVSRGYSYGRAAVN